MRRRALLVAMVFGLACGSAAVAEFDPPRPAGVEAPPRVETPNRRALEQVTLKSGRIYRGLIESTGPDAVKFVQIIRPDTPEMSINGRRISRQVIARVDPVGPQEHQQLEQLVRSFRSSDHFEGGQLARLTLRQARRAGWPVSRYRGPFFLLDSSADEATTRRSIVRMEQIFGAYELMLPPRQQPRSKLEIVLWGSPAQYHAFLGRRGRDMANPAFFSPEDNAVVAGLELSRFARQLRAVRSIRDEVRQQADDDRATIRQAGQRMERPGMPDDALDDMNRSRRMQADWQTGQMLRDLALADRQASASLEQASQRTFAMLYHEAFHAYLENYVYPHDQFDVPRWLNEGLAQIFENGKLEGDTLRFDGPSPMLLHQLQADLRSGQPLALGELLTSDQRGFLVTQPQDVETSHRSYLYSWGVAQYLTEDLHLLGTKALDDYVSKRVAVRSPRARFEQLVGQPLDEFETAWRQAMLGEELPLPQPASAVSSSTISEPRASARGYPAATKKPSNWKPR